MRLNPFRKAEPKPPVLLAVTPPRSGERTLLAVENLLGSIAVPEPFSLELAADADGVTLMARCHDKRVVRGQIAAHYPQAGIHELDPEEDPSASRRGRAGVVDHAARSSGPEYVPLRVFRDDDLLDPGSDPLLSILGALSPLGAGERIVARLLLRSLGPDWAEAHQVRAHQRPLQERRDSAYTSQVRHHSTDGVMMAVLALAGFAALKGYQWWQAGETWKAIALGTGIALGLAVGGWAWARWKRSRNRIHDPLLIKEKVSRIAFDAEIEVVAVLPATNPREASGGRRSCSAGSRPPTATTTIPRARASEVGKVRAVAPDPSAMHPSGPGLFGSRSVLGVREVACLWHPPGAKDETPLVERSGARVLLPPPRGTCGAARSWARPRRASLARSASPTTCCAATTSTWRARAWASPRSCTTSSPTSCGRRPRAATATRSSSSTPTPTSWATCWSRCPRRWRTRCGSSTSEASAASPASTCSTPASSPTATAPPTRWCAWRGGSGSSGGRACSRSSSRR